VKLICDCELGHEEALAGDGEIERAIRGLEAALGELLADRFQARALAGDVAGLQRRGRDEIAEFGAALLEADRPTLATLFEMTARSDCWRLEARKRR
jgi:hypothetical protein